MNLNIKVNIELNHMASVYHKGANRTVVITDDAERSIKELAEAHSKQTITDLARADALIRVLCETGKLRSNDQWRSEGDGFWAIRAGHVRFYGWYEPGGIFVVSHVICKRHQKLDPADKTRMLRNQTKYRNENKRDKS
jgi:hypothetical protein